MELSLLNYTRFLNLDADYSYALDTEVEDEFECEFPWGMKNKSGHCQCGHSLHETVFCVFNATDPSSSRVGILDCSCMTFNEQQNEMVIAHCLYNCENRTTKSKMINRVYHSIDSESRPSNFTEGVCGYLNRAGRMCGRCKDGHYPPVYSYSYKCIKCHDNRWYNWLLFTVEAFVPLTLFLVIVLVFRVSATSAKLSAFVFFAQNFSMPTSVQILLAASQGSQPAEAIIKTVVTLYSIWNLDFFRSVFPPICLHVTTMQVILLEYAIAFFPLLLLVLVYFAVKLQIHRVRGVQCLWNPMPRTMHQSWRLERSIIDAFATFFLLSFSKLLSTSFHALMFTQAHNAYGINVGRYVYSDASLKYFGPEHIVYGLLASLIFIVFVFLPMVLLFVYPLRYFQKCLTRLHMNRELIRTFMDSFQGCYKDGTNGTRDCRYFAGVYLLLRISLFIGYGITLTSLFYTVATVLFIMMGILIITVRPYNERYAVYNKVDAIIVLIQGLVTASILCLIFADIKGERYKTFSKFLVGFFLALPLAYITVITVHWLHTRSCSQTLLTYLRDKFKKCFSNEDECEELLDSAQRSYSTINY